jgi:hypothetical protein
LALALAASGAVGLGAGWALRAPRGLAPLQQGSVGLRPQPEARRDDPGGEDAPHGWTGHPEPPSSVRAPEAAAVPRAAVPSAREAELARQLGELKQREAALESELKQQQAGALAGTRQAEPRAFDLSPEDWRELGRRGTLKLRIPCAVSPTDSLSQTQLDRLGLSPADGAVVAAAFQHSADRVWALLGPLCSDTLGATPEQAAAKGPNFCRRLILREAAQNGTALPAFRRVAAYLAGDAPEPVNPGPVEALVLGLAREQRSLEAELAEHFGPDEADRLVFTDGLCFTEATHQLDAQSVEP